MRLPVCCCLLLLVVGIQGFDLDEAFEATTKPTPQPQPGVGGGEITKKPTPKPQPGVDGGETTKKPTPKPQPGVGGGDFSLEEALGGEDAPRNPTVKPQPGQGGGGGGDFGDSDLGEGGFDDPHNADGHNDNNPGGHDNKPSGRALQPSAGGEGQGQEGNQSVVAGIVSAVAVAAVGAVSSFIAYQKKKLCFKGATEDPENVNMESNKGDQSEPQVQSSLLVK
ncbi:CD99 antigen-like isoform X2 [Hyla sarda]|uniref:CD99 antigen-like isoform X2 n=1 Tax=Hyla sarda TaxID=327740 RepID=UPI0024C2F0F8|nr:CD99 antigen-like isoform X2 [Hyla sarda]